MAKKGALFRVPPCWHAACYYSASRCLYPCLVRVRAGFEAIVAKVCVKWNQGTEET